MDNTKAVKYMLIATLGFSIMQAFIKQLNHIHVIQIIFFRSFITAILSTNYLIRNKINLVGKKQTLLILRSIFGLTSMTLFFITIQRIPFGASVTLKYLSPIFAILLALPILKEKVKPIQWLLLTFAFIGILLFKGFDTRIDNLSFIFAIGGAFFGGCVYVTINKIGKSENPLVIVNYFMSFATLVSGILLFKYWTTPSLQELLILLSLGAFGYVGQKYMTTSFQMAETNVVGPIKYSELPYAFLIGFLFFGESYDLLACLGLLLLCISVYLNYRVKKSII